MVHQMKVETCGAYIGATNPYTGQALNHWLPRGNHWGKTYIHTDEEEEDDYNDCYGNDRKEYGMGWYDCNTDWQSWFQSTRFLICFNPRAPYEVRQPIKP